MPQTTTAAGEEYRLTRFRTTLLLDDLTFDRAFTAAATVLAVTVVGVAL